MENDSDLGDVIAGLRSIVGQHQAKRAALKAKLDLADAECKRAERALKLLTGNEHVPGKPPSFTVKRREKPARLSEERIETIRQAVLAYAEDHDEFRQVDIRTLPTLDQALARSSVLALAFDALRQDGVIRFARQEGNNKWFRLTRHTALNGHGES